MKFLRYILSYVGRALLSLRYDLKINDPHGILKKHPAPGKALLFLPNHPAEVDPIIVSCLFMRKYAPRPVVVEHFYYMAGAKFFLNMLRAIPIPDFEKTANSWKIAKANRTQQTVREGVMHGDSFLIYPSGHLRRSPREVVGGSSFIHSMVQEFPDIQVVLVRARGLWGSMFSRANRTSNPDFWKNVLKGIKITLKNGIFFVPKRRVDIDIELAGESLPREGSRLDLNKYLEGWYNALGDEEPTLVSYSCFKEELLELKPMSETKKEVVYTDIPEDVKHFVLEKVGELAGKPEGELTLEMNLSSDLGLDSLDIASMHAYVDEKYHIGPFAPVELSTAGEFCLAALGKKVSELAQQESKLLQEWPKEASRGEVMPPQGETVQEAFLRTCNRMGDAIACADARTPPLTYTRLKLSAIILSKKIAKYKGEHVAIMLPASCGVYIATLATLLAGKTPVMLNWTAGRMALEHADEISDFSVVLSSRKFLDKVDHLELGRLEEKLVLLEDLKASISLTDKLGGLLRSKLPPRAIMRGNKRARDTAVILFTSGTETKPKGVPLSHYNLLHNQKAALSIIEIEKTDVLYSVLPPFHSFGFSLTGLLPLLFGFKVFYSPDPLDSHAMAQDAQNWGITFMCLAPSFYRNLFRMAKKEQLETIRYFVTGAERAPPELFDSIRALGDGHHIIEGYGITECAPTVALTPLNTPCSGVGLPIPDTKLVCIDPDTLEPLPQGAVGEVCIHGPGVFEGYLGRVAKDPFITIEGEKWYRSGDLGHIEGDGSLILGGRISRFMKIGGEMISLTAVEDAIGKLMHPKEEGVLTHAAVAHDEDSGKPSIVLFTTEDVSLEAVNSELKTQGFARIVKVSEVKKLSEIPLTGTGKVAYRQLGELLSC